MTRSALAVSATEGVKSPYSYSYARDVDYDMIMFNYEICFCIEAPAREAGDTRIEAGTA